MKKDKYLNKENIDALILNDEISKLETKLSKLVNEIRIKRDKLKQICIHDDTSKKEDYVSGSYYDKAEYITTIVCNICDTVLDKKVKYGDFG